MGSPQTSEAPKQKKSKVQDAFNKFKHAVRIQHGKDDKATMKEVIDRSEEVLVHCRMHYIHGQLGAFQESQLYTVPSEILDIIEEDHGQKNCPLKRIDAAQAEKIMKGNKSKRKAQVIAALKKAAKDNDKEITDEELEEAIPDVLK